MEYIPAKLLDEVLPNISSVRHTQFGINYVRGKDLDSRTGLCNMMPLNGNFALVFQDKKLVKRTNSRSKSRRQKRGR